MSSDRFMATLVFSDAGPAKSIVSLEEGFNLKCSVESIRMPEEEKTTAISGLDCCGLLQEMVCRNQVLGTDEKEEKNGGCEIRCEFSGSEGKSWQSVFDIAEPLIEQDLASEACRYCVSFCLFGFIAIFMVHYLFLGALELKGTVDEEILCVRAGLSSALRIMGGAVVVSFCTWGFLGLVSKHRKRCSCWQDIELSRTRADDADERAEKAQCSKQQFMTYVFHNIRVPFNAIVLGLGYLRAIGDVETSSAEVKEKKDLVKLMLDCAETMTNVLDDVTDLGQGEDGSLQLHMEDFDLLQVVKFLVWGLKDLLFHSKISFKMNIEPMVESLLMTYRVIGDKHRVVQTLGIFLSNAVKFTPSGGRLELEVKCEEIVEIAAADLWQQSCFQSAVPSQNLQHSLMLPNNGVGMKHKVAKIVLSVKDFATGIPSQDQSKWFEPYSLTTGQEPNHAYSGLGLSMAKRFVERVGGFIGVKSINGKDSTFCLLIPYPLVLVHSCGGTNAAVDVYKINTTDCRSACNFQDELSSSSQIESRVHSVRTIKSKSPLLQDPNSRRRVLLVEDTLINRIILRKVLENLNLHCEEAENGKVAVDFFKQGRTYDLVLMDKEMPVMDGHEATRQLRSMGVKTPIIALTGNALQSDKDLFFEAGVDDFQAKPLSRDRLVQLLDRYGVDGCAGNRRG